ncbi:MAG: AbrB/MazE/SpoVT family DNA-binding domain-containing protein [Bifidobacteriaceae bacterium]|jgi:AbrB family looped-hinge helix DNA binding protein|nr:AbrB/MazE/SpoVT family DNA-binding domain-containing protein [Bifidobacteriaceae bacterium]
MITTIDKAGRLVVPKALRDQLGIEPGEVEVSAVANELRIGVPPASLVRKNGDLVLPATGSPLTPDQVRRLRLVDQR